VALQANLSLGLLGKENGLVLDLRELILGARLFHYCMAVNAGDAPPRVRARLPIGLDAALMTPKTDFVLNLGRLSRVLPETDEPPYALAPAGAHVVASRPVTTLAGLSLLLVARVEKKNLPHHRLGKFLELGGVTGFTNFVADIGCRLRCSWFRGPDRLHPAQQDSAEKAQEQKAPHISLHFPNSL